MRIDPAARKHGIPDEGILHALRNASSVYPQYVWDLLVGADRKGRDAGSRVRPDDHDEVVVFHAMPARPKFLR
jgi:hypothetical protein